MYETAKKNSDYICNTFKAWGENNPLAGNSGWSKIMDINKANAKALAEAGKTIAEGMQALAQRNVEIMQKNTGEANRFLKDVSSSVKKPGDNVARQADYAKHYLESALFDSREIFEITTRYNNEATDIINNRFSAALADLANANIASSGKKEPASKRSEAA